MPRLLLKTRTSSSSIHRSPTAHCGLTLHLKILTVRAVPQALVRMKAIFSAHSESSQYRVVKYALLGILSPPPLGRAIG